MAEPRYSLMISCPVDGDLIVVVEAKHKNKDTLRQAFALARAFVEDGQLQTAEAWDHKDDALLASSPSVRRPTNQPTKNKPQTRKAGKRNVVQQGDTRGKSRKRPRT